MSSDLTQLEQWVAPLLEKLNSSQRRRLMIALAREMRATQARNMAAQTGPDGERWQPRKTGAREAAAGSIKARAKRGRVRGAMFVGLRKARWLKAQAIGDDAVVQFVGRAARIAAAHHYGGPDEVHPGGPDYNYPARPLLGFNDELTARLRTLVLDHLTQ